MVIDYIDYFALEKGGQPGAFSRYDMEVFIPEVKKLRPGDTYVEIGVDRGRSLAIARAFANSFVHIYGVDSNKPKELEEYLENHRNVQFLWGDSVAIAERWKLDSGEVAQPIDLLFIDGDHSYKGCKRDIDAWYPYMDSGGVILFHDCDETSPGVVKAVNEFAKKIDKSVQLFKTSEKNTSMAKIQL